MPAIQRGKKGKADMNATKSGMSEYTTQELLDYVERTDAKQAKAPAIIRRTSFQRWTSNRSAILREVAARAQA